MNLKHTVSLAELLEHARVIVNETHLTHDAAVGLVSLVARVANVDALDIVAVLFPPEPQPPRAQPEDGSEDTDPKDG